VSTNERIFGKEMSKKFKIGDLVSWKSLGKNQRRNFGIIIDIFKKETGGREVLYSKVACFNGEKSVTIPITGIKLTSERKIYEM